MKSEDTQGLSRIYHLFFRVDGLKELNGQFKAYVEVRLTFLTRERLYISEAANGQSRRPRRCP